MIFFFLLCVNVLYLVLYFKDHNGRLSAQDHNGRLSAQSTFKDSKSVKRVTERYTFPTAIFKMVK